MNIQILAERKGKALNRIAAAAEGVSKATGAPGYLLNSLTVTNKDKDVEAMQRMEAVADLMEWLRGVPPATTPDIPSSEDDKKRKGAPKASKKTTRVAAAPASQEESE